MKKLTLILFAILSSLALGQEDNLMNFKNDKSFTLNTTLHLIMENDENTEENATFNFTFSKDHFSLPDYGYDFDIIDYKSYTEPDGDNVLEINAVYSGTESKVLLYFSLTKLDGIMILEETDTLFYFYYGDEDSLNSDTDELDSFLNSFDNTKTFEMNTVFFEVIQKDETVSEVEENIIINFRPAVIETMDFELFLQEYTFTKDEAGNRVLVLNCTVGEKGGKVDLIFVLDEYWGAIDMPSVDSTFLFYF